MTGIFLSLSRVLPDRYPLRGELQRYLDDEHGLGRLLDIGVIQPRLRPLYAWSAAELSIPQLTTLLRACVPAYAWDIADSAPWNPPPRLLDRAARRILPPRRIGTE
jgi:hypothetical protein